MLSEPCLPAKVLILITASTKKCICDSLKLIYENCQNQFLVYVAVTLTITGADEVYVYHGGQSIHYGYDVTDAHSLSLDDACVLAVFGVKSISNAVGILASTSTGVVTDASWKCSSDDPIGWYLPGFDDAAWAKAQVIDANGGSVFAPIAEISAEAKWIWAQDTSTNIACCRKTLC